MKKLITAVTGTMLMAVLFTGCGTNKYSAEDFCDISLKGTNGNGKVNVSYDSEMIRQIIDENSEGMTDMEEATLEILLYSVEFDVSPDENLENGDKVDITLNCDEKSLKEKGIAFTGTNFTYTVEGLNDVNTYSAKDFCDVSLSGTNGNGKINTSYNSDMLHQIIDENSEGMDEMEEATLEVLLYSAEFDINPNENLENGDTVTITLRCDEDGLADKGIAFSDTEFIYTVEGLEEPTIVDLMQDVEVTFEGTSPNGKVNIEYKGNDDVIKQNVTYYCSDDGKAKNGDTVTVEASYSSYGFENANYIADESTKTKEFTVSGLDEYLNEEADFSVFDDDIKAEEEKALDAMGFEEGEQIELQSLIKSDSIAFADYKVNSRTAIPVKEVFYSCNDKSIEISSGFGTAQVNNVYARIYKMTVNVEKNEKKMFTDENEIGYKTSGDLYFIVLITDIIKNNDGTISYESDNIKYYTYKYSKSFTLDEIFEDFDESLGNGAYLIYDNEIIAD